jgi:hypothetical protein
MQLADSLSPVIWPDSYAVILAPEVLIAECSACMVPTSKVLGS